MVDLPIKSLLNFDNLYRTNLARDYIEMQENIVGGFGDDIPSLKFEKQWSKIEKNNIDKFLFLKAPPIYGYFMNKVLFLKFFDQISKKGSQSLCFKINSKQEIENDFC